MIKKWEPPTHDRCLYDSHVSKLDGNPCLVCGRFRARTKEQHYLWVSQYYQINAGLEAKGDK